MNDDAPECSRLVKAIDEAIPDLSSADLLLAIGKLAQVYVARFEGSVESLLAVAMAAVMGIDFVQGDPLEPGSRNPDRRWIKSSNGSSHQAAESDFARKIGAD